MRKESCRSLFRVSLRETLEITSYKEYVYYNAFDITLAEEAHYYEIIRAVWVARKRLIQFLAPCSWAELIRDRKRKKREGKPSLDSWETRK